MKVLLFSGARNLFSISGLGREAVSDKSIEKTGERLLEAYKTAPDLSKKRQHNSR